MQTCTSTRVHESAFLVSTLTHQLPICSQITAHRANTACGPFGVPRITNITTPRAATAVEHHHDHHTSSISSTKMEYYACVCSCTKLHAGEYPGNLAKTRHRSIASVEHLLVHDLHAAGARI